VIKAKNEIMNRYCTSIDEATIERVLRFGTADIGEKYISVIRKAAGDYVDGIFETLRRYDYNPDLVKLHIVGGGACLVKNFGNYDPERVEINEDICATAKGYEYLASQMLRKER
jgi:plasmid segregation protein ParM